MQKELSKKELLVELENSRKQVYTLEQEKADLEILQEMTSEHCDEFELQIMEKVAERTRELHEKNKSLIKLNKEKNEFLGIAAHDLKNPLSV
ncbi:MAG: hypothetical protein GY862_27485, partial [Gammaproteobacteria bacterium]|nr:hypothetical protein [Gammaproteobacteria bacterium]